MPNSKQTGLGLYLTAAETAKFLDETPSVLFIDVRTPQEVDKTGLAAGIDAFIPLTLANSSDKPRLNQHFLPGMLALIQKHQIGPDHPIVFICRSGNRSAVAANLLATKGFRNVYTVTDGYEGDRAKSGPTKGQRTVNGWLNAGLEWQQRLASSCADPALGGEC